jgi:serine/threonine protein phosphatase 1
MLEFLKDPTMLSGWQQIGGLETLMSYGLTPSIRPDASEQRRLAEALRKLLPGEHRGFLQCLQPSFTCGSFFFAHAGVRPGVSLDRQKEEDLLWIREDFLHSEEDHGKIIVHGHTPVREPEILSNRINIDTGAYATGRLTCLIIENGGYFAL